MFTATLTHTFHAGHRLPQLGGKCVNLHGHSWTAAVTIAAPDLDHHGVIVEFGAFKERMRDFIDQHLDHVVLMGAGDGLRRVLDAHGQRIFVFGPGGDYEPAAWPTVEAVAAMIADHAHTWLADITIDPGAVVAQVTVRETEHNAATWHNRHMLLSLLTGPTV